MPPATPATAGPSGPSGRRSGGSRRVVPPGPALIRELREDDALEAELDLSHRAFGPFGDAERARRLEDTLASVRDRQILGVFDGAALLGTARFHDMRQWWHGRPVPMAGVAGVKITPEEQGRGLGKALVSRLLELIAARGYPLSALFPSTAPIYRSLGWELAGGLYQTMLPAAALSPLLGPEHGPDAAPAAGSPMAVPSAAVRRAGPDDAAEIIAVMSRVHQSARDCGPNTRTAAAVRRWLGDPAIFAYLAADGFLAYGWHGDNHEILVRQLIAGSAGPARALWQVVASHATMTQKVRALLGPQDPVGWLTRQPVAEPALAAPWMLRVVDAPAAIAARGFPTAARLSVPLRLDDAACPANSGRWTLEVSGGQGTLIRDGTAVPDGTGTPAETDSSERLPPTAPVRVGARGFAALYAGTPLATLRRSGLAGDGDQSADDALDSAFSGPAAYMVDHF